MIKYYPEWTSEELITLKACVEDQIAWDEVPEWIPKRTSGAAQNKWSTIRNDFDSAVEAAKAREGGFIHNNTAWSKQDKDTLARMTQEGCVATEIQAAISSSRSITAIKAQMAEFRSNVRKGAEEVIPTVELTSEPSTGLLEILLTPAAIIIAALIIKFL